MSRQLRKVINCMGTKLGVRPSKLTIGEARNQLMHDLSAKLEKTINSNPWKKHKRYYILVHAKMVGLTQMQEKIMPMTFKPKHKLIGTMLFHVDNKKGKFETVWVLPPDHPKDESLLTGKASERVIQDAQGLPVF